MSYRQELLQKRIAKAQQKLHERVLAEEWEQLPPEVAAQAHFIDGLKRPLRPVLVVDGHYSYRNFGYNGAVHYGKLAELLEEALMVKLRAKHYVSSDTESTVVEEILQAAGYQMDIRGIANVKGKRKQDNVDAAIVRLMVDIIEPSEKRPRGVDCNVLILVCGDQDLMRGAEAARHLKPGLTVWILGFQMNVSQQWRRQGYQIFHLENFNVWNNEEVKVQYRNLQFMQQKRSPFYQKLTGPTAEQYAQFQRSAPAAALIKAAELERPFLEAVKQNQVVVVTGETGCGKSTQLPKFVMRSSMDNRVVVTQSRRIAARSLAERVRLEINDNGRHVAYQIRGQDHVEKECRLVYCTTGVLLRQLRCGGRLTEYSHIFVDEVHERTWEADLLLSILKQALPYLPQLKVIVMSATINAQRFLDYFDGFVREIFPMRLPRRYKRDDFFLEQAYDELHSAIEEGRYAPVEALPSRMAILQEVNPLQQLTTAQDLAAVYMSENSTLLFTEARRQFAYELLRYLHYMRPRDEAFLVFLPGLAEIQRFRQYCETFDGALICVLHSEAKDSEASVFDTPEDDERRIILSTDIAENAVTLPDVHLVLDVGLQKVIHWSQEHRMASLDLFRVTKDAAIQRAGRTGRVRDGHCYRIITEAEFNALDEFRKPAMSCTPLAPMLLEVLHMDMPFLSDPLVLLACAMDPPDDEAAQCALNRLIAMECVKEVVAPSGGSENDALKRYEPTPKGHLLRLMPLGLEQSLVVLYGHAMNCVVPAVVAAAVLEQRKLPFVDSDNIVESTRRMETFAKGWPSDLIAAVNAYRQWKAMLHQVSDEAPLATTEQVRWDQENFISTDWMLEIDSTVQSIFKALSMMNIYLQPSASLQLHELGPIWDRMAESNSLLIILLTTAAFSGNLLRVRPYNIEPNFLFLSCNSQEEKRCTLEYRGDTLDQNELCQYLQTRLGPTAIKKTQRIGPMLYVSFADEHDAALAFKLQSAERPAQTALYREAKLHHGVQTQCTPLFSLTHNVQLECRSLLTPICLPTARCRSDTQQMLLAGHLLALQRHRTLFASNLTTIPQSLADMMLLIFHPSGTVVHNDIPHNVKVELDADALEAVGKLQGVLKKCIDELQSDRLATLSGVATSSGPVPRLATIPNENRKCLLSLVTDFISAHENQGIFAPYAAKVEAVLSEQSFTTSQHPTCPGPPSPNTMPGIAAPLPGQEAAIQAQFRRAPALDFTKVHACFPDVSLAGPVSRQGMSRAQIVAMAAANAFSECHRMHHT